MVFSREEKRDMIRVYYSCNRNSTIALRRYLEEYPERQQPDRRIFQKLYRNLREHGQFKKARKKYGSRVTEEESQNVLRQQGL